MIYSGTVMLACVQPGPLLCRPLAPPAVLSPITPPDWSNLPSPPASRCYCYPKPYPPPPRWGNAGFAQYCVDLEAQADEALTSSPPEVLEAADAAVKRAVQLELGFWGMAYAA
jgi:hypothetical protein